MFKRLSNMRFDWMLFISVAAVSLAGLAILFSPESGTQAFFYRQLVFTGVGMTLMIMLSWLDVDFFNKSWIVTTLYVLGVLSLLGLVFFGATINGAQSWYRLGPLTFQPVDPMKFFLIILLAKYLSRRHVEIGRFKHILVTGAYFFVPFFLIFRQPDLGSSLALIAIWVGMLVASGLTRRHIFYFITGALIIIVGSWFLLLKPYQKARITSFVYPMQDISGSGYNAYQSIISVGSGQLLGKGVGYGTQSRLRFLPEHRTDFIFASFAEEWGFAGTSVLIVLFLTIILRLLSIGMRARGNFEKLIIIGIVAWLGLHILINIGMNIGIVPVTGITLPFMSYGGSHILVEYVLIGIAMSVYRNQERVISRSDMSHEFTGFAYE